MKNLPTRSVASSRLRMVFDDAVVMLKLATGATYGDVAELWDDATDGQHGATVAIAVTMDPSLPLPANWLFPAMSGAAMCGAPSLRHPPIYDYQFRSGANRDMGRRA